MRKYPGGLITVVQNSAGSPSRKPPPINTICMGLLRGLTKRTKQSPSSSPPRLPCILAAA